MVSTMFAKLRDDFPMLKQTMHGKPLIYLDSAATAQKPQAVIDAMSRFYQNSYGTVHRSVYNLCVTATKEYQAARERIQGLLNAAHSEEIIFTRGTTESINLVAYSFGKAFIKPGDEILITEMEHHSNIVPWQLLCEDRGAVLKVAPINDQGELILDEFEKLLTVQTRLVAICHISNALGTVNPLKSLITIAHRKGAKVLVDGAQSTPHMKVDVQDLDADFYVFSGHKLYGPTGIGVLYGKRDLLDVMPPYQGGGDMVDVVTFEKTTYQDLPLKFEAGTPMIAEVIGLGAAVKYVQEIGFESIESWEKQLLQTATEQLESIPGLHIIGTAPKKGALISFTVDDIHPLDIGTLLDLQGIAIRTGHHCTQPVMRHFGVTATARMSMAFYNTLEEVDSFVDSLKHVIKSLK